MLTELIVKPKNDSLGIDPLSLPIINAENERIQVINIDGLGPVTAALTSSNSLAQYGEIFGNASLSKRNIVLTLRPNADWVTKTVTDLRQDLYPYFKSSNEIILEFRSTDEMEPVWIQGVVESMEPDVFSADPQLNISIICFNPMFVGETIEISGDIGVDPTSGGTKILETIALDLPGTEEVGFNLRLRPNPSDDPPYTGQLKIWGHYVSGSTEYMKLNSFFHIDEDDGWPIEMDFEIAVSTSIGKRYVRLINPTYSPNEEMAQGQAWMLADPIKYPRILPGANVFRIEGPTSGKTLEYTLKYANLYGGL